MKNTYILLITLFTVLSCKAQIIPVEDFESYTQELPDGVHVKDINNLLDKFVGTWVGTFDNKDYEFRVLKYTRISTISDKKFDKLLIRYKITNNFGKVMANTLNLPNESPLVIKGSYLAATGSYVLNYIGLNHNCGQNGSIFIAVYEPTKMKLFLNVSGQTFDCISGSVPQVIPTEWIDLTKQ
jgi:hypothetical protein